MAEYIIDDEYLDYETVSSAEAQGILRELVRCKDCQYGGEEQEGFIGCEHDIGTFNSIIHEPNWFCADGKHKLKMDGMTNKAWLATLSPDEWWNTVHWLIFMYGRKWTDTRLAVMQWLEEEHSSKSEVNA